MPIMAKEEKTYEPIPTGMQQAVCARVCDIGTHQGDYKGKTTYAHKIVIIWELSEAKTEGQFKGEPFQISKFYTLSLGKKANLRNDLDSWRGKKFTEDELQDGFDLERLIGVNCFLNIIEGEGKFKIQAITPLAKGMATIRPKMTSEPEWIGKFRAESMEARGVKPEAQTTPAAAVTAEDDLPF